MEALKDIRNFTQEYQTIETIKILIRDQTYGMIIQNGFFKNTLTYPNPNDYEINKICEHCGSKYKDKDIKIKLREERDKYHGEDNRLYMLFKEGLFLYYNLEHNEKTSKAFSIAWERGHSSGYHEVYQEFDELVDLLK